MSKPSLVMEERKARLEPGVYTHRRLANEISASAQPIHGKKLGSKRMGTLYL